MRIFFKHTAATLPFSDPLASLFLFLAFLCPFAHSFSTNIKNNMSSSAELRSELLDLIGTNPGGHLDAALRSTFADKLKAYAASDDADPSDVLFAIGSSVYGVSVPAPAKKAKTTNGGSAGAGEEVKQARDVY